MFQIDNQSRQAIYEQIIGQIERHILAGLLNSGDKLPSVRSLSVDLHVNPNTVQRAYAELERVGVIVTAPGRGAFVSEQSAAVLKDRKTAESLKSLKALLRELNRCGVTKEEIIQFIEANKGGSL